MCITNIPEKFYFEIFKILKMALVLQMVVVNQILEFYWLIDRIIHPTYEELPQNVVSKSADADTY